MLSYTKENQINAASSKRHAGVTANLKLYKE